MRSLLLLLLFALLLFIQSSIAQQVHFVKQVPPPDSPASVFVKDSNVDSAGNSYVVGQGQPGIAPYSFSVPSRHVFVTKYDLNGTLVWNVVLSSPSSLLIDSVVADNDQNCYVTGSFFEELEIPGLENQFSTGNHSTYIIKIGSGGHPEWVQLVQTESDGYQEPQDITLDRDGNVYVQGFFIGNTVFDNDAVTLLTSSVFSNWVAKYSNNGTFLWAFGSTGTSQGDQMATNHNGTSCIAGIYQSSVVYGDFNITSPDYGGVTPFSAFVVQFDSEGSILYLVNITSNFYAFPVAVSISDDNRCRVIGNVWGSFDVQGHTLDTERNGSTIFYLLLDENGNVENVDFSEGGYDNDAGGPLSTDMSCDEYASCWITGQFYDGFTFSGFDYSNTSSNGQIFISKRNDSTGSIDYNLQSSNEWATPEAISVDEEGEYVVTSGNFISGFEIDDVVLTRDQGANNLFQNYYLISIVEETISETVNNEEPESPVPENDDPNCSSTTCPNNNTRCCNGSCYLPDKFYCGPNFELLQNPPDWEKRIPWPFCFGVECPTGTLCCQGKCYDPHTNHCPRGRQICPIGEDACSDACFSESEFSCDESGNLIPR